MAGKGFPENNEYGWTIGPEGVKPGPLAITLGNPEFLTESLRQQGLSPEAIGLLLAGHTLLVTRTETPFGPFDEIEDHGTRKNNK